MFLSKLFQSKASKAMTVLGVFAMVMGAGAAAISFAAENGESIEGQAATATTVYYAVDTTYTVKCNVHFGSNDSDPWGTYTMSKVSGTYGIYKATFTDKWNGLATMQLQLYNGESFVSQVVPISSWTTPSTYNNKLYYNGSWVTSFKEVKKSTTLSSSTGRVFFYNSGTHWANNGTCAVYAWGGDATKSIDSKITMEGTFYHFAWFQDDNDDWYGYADIPTNVTAYKIAKLNNANYVTTLAYDSTNEQTCDSFAYVRYGETSGNWITTGGAHNDVAGAKLMIKVINAYNTCSSSALSGYGAYSALNESFYSHATAAAKSANASSYNGSSATIQTHFEAMADRASGKSSASVIPGAPTGQESPLTTTLWIVLASGIAGLAAIGSAYFISKKKKRNRA